MNPSDDDRQQDDISSDLFPNAGQRLSSHNFYSSEPANPAQDDYDGPNTSEPEDFCPRCDAPLEIREGALGKYIACTRFPDCKFTQPYDDIPASAPQAQDYDDDEVVEKDYLKEAADELSEDKYEDEPIAAPHDNLDESNDDDPPSQSYGEASPPREDPPAEEIYGEPDTEPTLPEEEAVDELPEPIHEEPVPEPEPQPEESIQTQEEIKSESKSHGNRAFLPNHPIWLKTKSVTDGANWVEMKQKRQIAQKAGGFAPAKPAAPGIVMPSPEELAETLKKLESSVQKLQNDEEQLVPPIAEKQPSTAPDEYDDDLLPESIREALSKKSED
jgi:ssDNA-binding Zn-finger/Zn-ribbon topoisomerase 1